MKKTFTATLLIICILFSLSACRKDTDAEYYADSGNVNTEAPVSSNDLQAEEKAESSDEADQNSATVVTNSDTGSIISTNMGTGQSVTNSSSFITYGDTNHDDTVVTETGFIETEKNNISTFAADVDTAAYTLMREYINSGRIELAKNSVRVEEMINYFKYDYASPEGNQPFSVNTEVFDCPWNSENRLIRIGLATKKQDYSSLPASNIVFLIDVSGSMNLENKLPLVKEACSAFAETLKETDRVSIVTYASEDRVVLDGVKGSDGLTIQKAIENLSASGGTYGSKGIITAYEIAQKHFIEGGNNRIILATDGDLNIGITSVDELEKLITEKKNSGVFLSVMGFGTGNLKDDKLEVLADKGNGNYSFIDSKQEARRVLIDEAGGTLITVAKDVKLQTVFNKDAVSEYRLIGYENRTMASEDFENDKKDGGEIGAGHQVTAIYEVKLKDKDSAEYVKLAIRHKEPDGDESILNEYVIGAKDFKKVPSEDSIFAASVAQFGLILKEDELISGKYSEVYSRITELETVKNDPYKKEFAELVKKFA